MLINLNNIGKQYAFTNEGKVESFNFEDVLNIRNKNLNLNSIVSICSSGYIVGNDTLVKEIQRKEWLTNDIINELNNLPKTKYQNLNSAQISEMLKAALKNEVYDYIKGYKTIGILLSGGLDSRIVAGLLKEVIEEYTLDVTVIAYNWGLKNSRDVIYAKEIASRFEWEYEHLLLNEDVLKRNFYNNITIGCEVSPLHLHCMSQVANDTQSEIILAGTYGDSIGRGLFSGKHVKEINEHQFEIKNDLDLFKDDFFESAKMNLDIKSKDFYQYLSSDNREFHYYANYLRRMLSTPMSIIAKEKPLYQLFTSPEVYRIMLSLNVNQRNDEIYKIILTNLPNKIGLIPYAKDGKIFIDHSGEIVDRYYSKSHTYGKWLRKNLRNFINENLDIDLLYSLNIFKKGSLERLYYLWSIGTNDSNNKMDEVISFLTNLSILLNNQNLNVETRNWKKNRKSNLKFLRNYLYVKVRNIKRP